MYVLKTKMSSKQYEQYIKNKMPKPAYLKNCVAAFIVGGLICDVAQLISNTAKSYGYNQEAVSSITAASMVFLGAFLTGLGIYDRIGKFAGAGSIVPITGFANSIVSPAMEFKREGFVFGVGAKMFILAGPVLVYGVSVSILIGTIYYILGK
ncbi:MAG: stage V sporulation protein AC [Gracilibacteraceae bacterium]|jgi:stage V sporulation protein AC|nr:stage V sporulation protein AC [Gracilibacteraceae bacterium]